MLSREGLPPRTLKLLERFRVQRAKADAAINELDATAHVLACTLLDHGLTMREAAPLMSREDNPFTHMMVAFARDGRSSRKPWFGRGRKSRKRDRGLLHHA